MNCNGEVKLSSAAAEYCQVTQGQSNIKLCNGDERVRAVEGLSDRQKLILWIEAGQKTLEMACRLIEENKAQQALGYLHAEIARAEDKRLKLLMEDAQDKEEKREQAELEHLWEW